MSAVVLDAGQLPEASALLARLRSDLGRRQQDPLHWRNVKTHSQRLRAVQLMSAAEFLVITNVVVCKPHLAASPPLDDDHAYLYTLRFLLERLSWLARDQQTTVAYTLAHIIRFKLSRLREYEEALRGSWECRIAWDALDPGGGRIDQPSRVEHLQLADFAASATFQAFEPDAWGNTERRYLQTLAPRLYRRESGSLTSYGLKMHPWNDAVRAAYPWVTAL